MSRTFYFRHGDEVCGPVTTQQLRELVADGTLRKTDYVRPAAQDKWYVAGGVKGLFPDRVQSARPTRPVAPAPREHSSPTSAPPTDSRTDIEGFERDRKRRRADRRKSLVLWAGATASIAIISLVVALPLIRSARGPENHSGNYTRSNTVRSPAPDEEEGPPKVSASDPAPRTLKPTGIGWSLADVQRKWGDEQGWDWYHTEPALSGEPGVIDYRARHADGRTEQIQVVGIPDNLRSFGVLSSIEPGEDASDPEKLAEWSLRASGMAAEVAGADPEDVAKWFITVFWRFVDRVVDHHDITHTESRKFGQVQLHVMFVLLKTGFMSTVGVGPLDGPSNAEPRSVQQEQESEPALPHGVFERIFALADPAVPKGTRDRWLAENNSTRDHWNRMM